MMPLRILRVISARWGCSFRPALATAPLQGLRSALPTRCSSADPLPENPTKAALRTLPKVRSDLAQL
jgi:hypothetical protein